MLGKKDRAAFNRLLNAWGQLELIHDRLSRVAAKSDATAIRETLAAVDYVAACYLDALNRLIENLG